MLDERRPLLGDQRQEEQAHHRLYQEPHHVIGEDHHHHHHHGHPVIRERIYVDIEGGGGVIKSEPYVYLGFTFAVLAGFCFTSSNVMVKYLPDVNSWQLLFVRCALQIVTMIPIMIASKSCPFGTPDFATRWRIAAQGVLGGFLLLAIYQAVGSLPLGDATAIFFSSPAFTMILSFFILRDHCGFLRVLISVTLLGGVVLLSRPPSIFPPPPFAPNGNASNYSNPHHHHQPDQYKVRVERFFCTVSFVSLCKCVREDVKILYFSADMGGGGGG